MPTTNLHILTEVEAAGIHAQLGSLRGADCSSLWVPALFPVRMRFIICADWYHISFPNDRWQLKCLVYTIYLIEFVQTILVSHDAFNAYAKFYGNLDELNAMQNEWLTVPVMSSIGKHHSKHFISTFMLNQEPQ